MANGGWYGTKEEWARIEAPLKSLDADLERFASKYGLTLTKNYKDTPERSLTWGNDVSCLIQVFLVDQSALTFDFWICASQDRGDSRYWKNEKQRTSVRVLEMFRDFSKLLEMAKDKLDHWALHPDELEFATKMVPIK